LNHNKTEFCCPGRDWGTRSDCMRWSRGWGRAWLWARVWPGNRMQHNSRQDSDTLQCNYKLEYHYYSDLFK